MTLSDIYSTCLKISILLVFLSLILPLHISGEYVCGYTIYPLLVKAAPLVVSDIFSAARIASYALTAFLYFCVIVSLHERSGGRALRAIFCIVFLALILSSVTANIRDRLFPPGPSAIAILSGLVEAAIVYGVSVFDMNWK